MTAPSWWLVATCVGTSLVAGGQPEGREDTHRLAAVALAEEQRGFSGAVLVAKGDHVLVDLALGTVAGRATAPDAQYLIASIGKQFTATAVLHCLDRRGLAVETPLARVWADVPGEKRGITVRQILSHTSGLPASDTGELATSADEARRSILALPLASLPGSRFAYSNANYQLGAALVEHLCAEPYGRVVRRDLLDRAGLRDTGRLPDDTPSRLAALSGAMPDRLSRLRWGGQGYFSTARDLFRWQVALNAGRVLSPDTRRIQLVPVAPIQEGHVALGWFLGRTRRGASTIFTRGNEDFGPNGLVYYYPEPTLTIVVLTHGGDADDVSWSRAMLTALERALDL